QSGHFSKPAHILDIVLICAPFATRADLQDGPRQATNGAETALPRPAPQGLEKRTAAPQLIHSTIHSHGLHPRNERTMLCHRHTKDTTSSVLRLFQAPPGASSLTLVTAAVRQGRSRPDGRSASLTAARRIDAPRGA